MSNTTSKPLSPEEHEALLQRHREWEARRTDKALKLYTEETAKLRREQVLAAARASEPGVAYKPPFDIRTNPTFGAQG